LHGKLIAHKRDYYLRACCNCGLIFVWPQPAPEALAALYQKAAGYFATTCTELSKTSPRPATKLHRTLRAHGISGGRLLDVGCGNGSLIYHMRRLGWKVAGVEINPDTVAIARKNGLNVKLAQLHQRPFPDGFFDVVYMGDVIEHLTQPRQALSTSRRVLRPGGLIVIKTPNARCGFARYSLLFAQLTRLAWPFSEAPYHLFDFSPATLTRMVTNTGFRPLRVCCSGRMPFFYTVGASGFFDELKLRMKTKGRYRLHLLLANIPKLTAVAGMLFAFHILGIASDVVCRTGPRMTLIARRT
jgi:2-polyprenyl-3-methyl-5-hydroxy-6-metoxy-1,4-benzoquinol methylase